MTGRYIQVLILFASELQCCKLGKSNSDTKLCHFIVTLTAEDLPSRNTVNVGGSEATSYNFLVVIHRGVSGVGPKAAAGTQRGN